MTIHASTYRLPYCVVPVTVSQGELAYINKQNRRLGAASYEAPLIAIARIGTQASASAKRLDSWVTHPDERVVIALLDRDLHRATLSEAQVIGLARRALEGARSKDVVWTPLLDALSFNLPFEVPRNAEMQEVLTLIIQSEEALRRWIRTSAAPADLASLMNFRSSPVRDQLAADAPCLDVATVKALAGCPWRDSAMATNPALTGATIAALTDHVFRTVMTIRTSSFDFLEQYVVLLHKLLTRGGTLSETQLVELLQRLPELQEDLEQLCGGYTRHGADTLNRMVSEVTIATAYRCLPALCAHRDHLVLLFQSKEERVRRAALTWLAEGLITMEEAQAA